MSGGTSAAPLAAAPAPPNLRGTALARGDARAQVDLKDLDRFHAFHKAKS